MIKSYQRNAYDQGFQAHLQSEQVAYIDAKVDSGAYATSSEVIRAGLRALQERDAAIERWLQDEVAPVYDAMKAPPGRKLSAKSIFSEARARYAAKCKAHRSASNTPSE